jgi:dTDP-4-amino-4,6-dideoxygalactose transaminase
MSEVHAAVGLANLETLDKEIATRREIAAVYQDVLAQEDGLVLPGAAGNPPADPVSYFPLRIRGGERVRDALLERLVARGILARRYFFPLVSEFDAFHRAGVSPAMATPETYRTSREIICLPVHGRMGPEDAQRVATAVRDFL